jgi:type III restriction enzyme
MQTVENRFSLADITNIDRFKLLGAAMAADPAAELWRTKVSARRVEGKDGLQSTQLVTSEAVDKVSAQVPLLPLEEAVRQLSDMVLGASIVPGRSNQRAALTPIVDAVLLGLGSHAQEVLSTNLDRVAGRVITLITDEQRAFTRKPEYEDVVKVETFAPVRVGRPSTTADRVSKFERGVGYTGWQRSMYEQAWFDSGTERDAANAIDGSAEVLCWVRLNTDDCPILWSGMNRWYNPDFIVVEADGGHWIVEVKMEKEIASPDVLGKAEAAQRWVNHVNASELTGAKWAYLLVSESDVAAARGDWTGLRSLNRI